MSRIDELTEALFAIYSRAGAEVKYTTDDGRVRPYWANRYRQALQRSVEEGDVVGFVARLVTREDASRGFGYLQEAGRLDLTVEAVVVRDFPDLFGDDVVDAARERLAAVGYQVDAEGDAGGKVHPLAGRTVKVEITFDADGVPTARVA